MMFSLENEQKILCCLIWLGKMPAAAGGWFFPYDTHWKLFSF